MKKSLLFLGLLIALVSVSCKKGNNDTATDLKTQMIGKWNLDTYVNNQYDANGVLIKASQTTYTGRDGDYIIFNSDGTSTQHFAGINTSSNSTFSINSNTRFTFADAANPSITTPCRVVNISANLFTFISEGPKYPNSGYTEITSSYKR